MRASILLVTLDFPPARGGVARMYGSLATLLAPELTVLTVPSAEADEEQTSYDVRRALLIAPWGWPRWRYLVKEILRSYQRLRRPLVLAGQVLPVGTAAWLLSLVLPLQYGVIIHGMDITVAVHARHRRWLLRRILRRSTVIVAANQFIAAEVKRLGLAREPIHVVYPPVALQQPKSGARQRRRAALHIPDDALILLTTARLVARKGIAEVIGALPVLWRQWPGLHYVIIGEGPELSRLRSRAAATERATHIHFLGGVNDEVLVDWLSAADIFVMTPHGLADGDTEGLGIVYLEASAAGLPVVGTYHGGVAEAILNNETGFLVPERDVPALTRVLQRLLAEPNLRRSLGLRGRAWVTTQFHPNKVRAALYAALSIR